MTAPRYATEEISLAELHKRPSVEHIAPGETRYNTASEERALETIVDAFGSGERIAVYGHDSNSNIMAEAFNPSHDGFGVRPEWAIEQIDRYGSLSEAIRAHILIDDPGEIDFFTIVVFHD